MFMQENLYRQYRKYTWKPGFILKGFYREFWDFEILYFQF